MSPTNATVTAFANMTPALQPDADPAHRRILSKGAAIAGRSEAIRSADAGAACGRPCQSNRRVPIARGSAGAGKEARPNTQLRIFKNSSHMPFWEEPAAYIGALTKFLDAHRSRRSRSARAKRRRP